MAAPTTVDEYIAGLPDDRRAAIEELRRTIRAAAPDAIESIAYLMPAFRTNGQFLVSYAAFKNHYSMFPASEAGRPDSASTWWMRAEVVLLPLEPVTATTLGGVAKLSHSSVA